MKFLINLFSLNKIKLKMIILYKIKYNYNKYY